jgi:hypothetical protein
MVSATIQWGSKLNCKLFLTTELMSVGTEHTHFMSVQPKCQLAIWDLIAQLEL